MSDERGKGPSDPEEQGDRDEQGDPEEQGDAEEQEPAPDDPGFAGTDWLLSQLGEPVEPDEADAAGADVASPQSAVGTGSHERGSRDTMAVERGDEDEGPRVFRSTFTPTTPIVLPAPVAPTDTPAAGAEDNPPEPAQTTQPAPKMRWSWTTGTVESIEPTDADQAVHAAPDASLPDAAPETLLLPLPEATTLAADGPEAMTPPTGTTDYFEEEEASPPYAPQHAAGGTREPLSDDTQESDDAREDEQPSGFVWGLTPGVGVDPLVHPDAGITAAAEAAAEPGPVPEPEPEPADDYQPMTRAERKRAEEAAAVAPVEGDGGLSASPAPGGPAAAASIVAAQGASRLSRPDAEDQGEPSGTAPRRTMRQKRTTRILIVAAVVLLLILILIGLYVFGRQLPGMVGAASTPVVTASPLTTKSPTPTPSVTVAASGPLAPGTHSWDTLRGGECVQPFSTPWAQTFRVVDCASPHAAQMVYTNVFSSDPKAAYPGAQQLASQINLLCTKPGILNLDAAGQLSDAQMQGTYPATEQQWRAGQRSYFCFVNRASGQPITGSLAGSGPA